MLKFTNIFNCKLRKNDDADDHGGHSDQERGTFNVAIQSGFVDYIINQNRIELNKSHVKSMALYLQIYLDWKLLEQWLPQCKEQQRVDLKYSK